MKQVIAIILVAVCMTACTHKEAEVETSDKFVLSDTMRHLIAMDTVRYCTTGDEITLSGIIGFNENNVVKVYPRSSGQVLEARVSLGDHVSKGQTLAIIRSADVAGSYNDLNSATADLAIARRQMENAESLYKSGISSEKEYNEARQNYQKALAARDKVEAVININGGGKTSAGGQYIITAPIDGYIVEKKIAAGAFIRQDMSDNLFTISDLKNVWVNANVYAGDIARVKNGDKVSIYPLSYPDKTFTGKVDQMSQVLDPQSKAMKVRINVDNKDMLLKPEMYAKVVIDIEDRTQAICIPSSGVITHEGRTYVVIYNNDSDLKVAQVHALKVLNERTFIKDGVEPGQKIVTRNQILLFNQLIND